VARQGKRCFGWVNHADEIIVLWCDSKNARLQASDGEKNPLRLWPNGKGSGLCRCNLRPLITGLWLPRRACQCDEPRACLLHGHLRIGRDAFGKRMGGVDQHVDHVREQISRKPLRAAKTANTHRQGQGLGACCTSSQRHDCAKALVRSKKLCEGRGLSRSSKDQDIHRTGLMTDNWLTLIGLGEDGRASLSSAAQAALSQAEHVWGGARHFALVGDLTAQTHVWPSPLLDAIPDLLAQKSKRVVVLASGDPFCYGIGATLVRYIPAQEMRSFPQPSSFSLAANRMGWPLQDVTCLSAHGRPLDMVRPHLSRGAKLLLLAWDETTPGKLATFLVQRGFGESRITCLEAMGGPREGHCSFAATDTPPRVIDPLHVIAVDVAGEGTALPLTPGRADDLFLNDGQITKAPIRALTLASLAPQPGQLLWDIGGGSGAISIEWMLAHSSLRAIAIEERPDRAARIRDNALRLGVPHLQVVEGVAPAALEGLPQPDAIFVGGGGETIIRAALARKPFPARFVVNAVTLETQALVIALHKQHGGHLASFQHGEAVPLGGYNALRQALPLLQWVLGP